MRSAMIIPSGIRDVRDGHQDQCYAIPVQPALPHVEESSYRPSFCDRLKKA